MKRKSLTWALALTLLLGGLGIAQTSRAADEGAQPAPSASASTKSGTKRHHHHSKKKKSSEATQAATSAGQPAK